MSVKDAVTKRFAEICTQRNIRINELAGISGVTPSTVYSMMDSRRREVSITLIKKLCDGLEISLAEFFTSPIFDKLTQEIYENSPTKPSGCFIFHYSSQLPTVLGKGRTSRMLPIPVRYITQRSKPRPKPA